MSGTEKKRNRVTISFTVAEVREALIAHNDLPAETVVDFEVTEGLVGYGMNERMAHEFTGAKATCLGTVTA